MLVGVLPPDERRRKLERIGGSQRLPTREQRGERAYLVGGLNFTPIFGEEV